jgi:3-oxoacyl-[acyl-carrier protein] reductase
MAEIRSEIGLSGEVALVTGASRGIGRAIALELGHAGAFVAGTATSDEGVEAIDTTFADEGIEGFGLELDLRQPDTFKERVAGIVERAGGPISILINNAGITRDGPAVRMPAEDWDEVIATNLTGPFRLTQAVLMGMMRARSGSVVNIGSVVGTLGSAGQVNYAAAKAGLVGMTKSLAHEYGSRGVRFNVVAPGYVDTDMTRALPPELTERMLSMTTLGRAFTPEEIATAVRETIASDKNGEVIAIDGGLTSRI